MRTAELGLHRRKYMIRKCFLWSLAFRTGDRTYAEPRRGASLAVSRFSDLDQRVTATEPNRYRTPHRTRPTAARARPCPGALPARRRGACGPRSSAPGTSAGPVGGVVTFDARIVQALSQSTFARTGRAPSRTRLHVGSSRPRNYANESGPRRRADAPAWGWSQPGPAAAFLDALGAFSELPPAGAPPTRPPPPRSPPAGRP